MINAITTFTKLINEIKERIRNKRRKLLFIFPNIVCSTHLDSGANVMTPHINRYHTLDPHRRLLIRRKIVWLPLVK